MHEDVYRPKVRTLGDVDTAPMAPHRRGTVELNILGEQVFGADRSSRRTGRSFSDASFQVVSLN